MVPEGYQLPTRSDLYTQDPHPRNTDYPSENECDAVDSAIWADRASLVRWTGRLAAPNLHGEARMT
jgi:hypothetical protein